MNRCARIQALSIGVFLLPSIAVCSEDASQNLAIQLFIQACVVTYAHAPEVESVVAKFGLTEIAGADAQQYLVGQPGRAWRGSVNLDPYAVTLLPNGLCTVFVHAGDTTQIHSAVESWLPPTSSGIAISRENLSSRPDLTTTAYELRGGQVQERWVITISSDPNSSLRAVLSWNRL